MSATDQPSLAELWLRCYRPRPAARLRLVCFPHAGGSAAFYRDWARRMPESVELAAVQYPGRLDRLHEPPPASIDELVTAVTSALRADPHRPIALFGHSLGAVIAHEVAVRLSEDGGAPPVRLIVSGRPPPRLHRGGAKHLADDEELWAEIVRLGGTSQSAVDHEELRALMLPVLRNDYRLAETYRPRLDRSLCCPVTALTGDADSEVTVKEMSAWEELTTAAFELRVFAGDHFYLVPHQEEVITTMLRALGVAPLPPQSWPSAP
ncbi:thioesterase II family protein [Salinactinospora qingdaonensis]|uniref:Alpha/beta fold hydrolase n=1 Tax=Salinactinospora qingdaonensis TaxID=702744 RepID=A0ABP7F9Q1_9ACTN